MVEHRRAHQGMDAMMGGMDAMMGGRRHAGRRGLRIAAASALTLGLRGGLVPFTRTWACSVKYSVKGCVVRQGVACPVSRY